MNAVQNITSLSQKENHGEWDVHSIDDYWLCTEVICWTYW